VGAAVRERLPNRRSAETWDLEALGLHFRASVGRYDDGRIGEIFLTNHKAGSAAGIMASDAAVLCSLLLQHGVSIDVIRHALMRDPRGKSVVWAGASVEPHTAHGILGFPAERFRKCH
jgi:hypothetical protein